jgi:hypothetical protein
MSFFSLFHEIVLALVWALANVIYLDLKRKGIRGFTRFAAFWTGQPTTWITFFAVRDGRQPTFHAPDEDEDERDLLLADIRRDRTLREGGESTGGGSLPSGSEAGAADDGPVPGAGDEAG